MEICLKIIDIKWRNGGTSQSNNQTKQSEDNQQKKKTNVKNTRGTMIVFTMLLNLTTIPLYLIL